MKVLNGRIKQLTKLVLSSRTVKCSWPGGLVKIDFDVSPYRVRSQFTNPIQLRLQRLM